MYGPDEEDDTLTVEGPSVGDQGWVALVALLLGCSAAAVALDVVVWLDVSGGLVLLR